MNHKALSTGLPGVEFIAPPHKQVSTLDTLGGRRCVRLIGLAVLKEESSSFFAIKEQAHSRRRVTSGQAHGTLHSLSSKFCTTASSAFRTFDSVEITRSFAVDA